MVSARSDDFEEVSSTGVRVGPGTATVDLRFERLHANRMQLDVIEDGAAAVLQETPGSAWIVSRQELAETRPADGNEVLRTIPGVHIREDSGPAGMRLNIGVRGLNPDRSRTLLVLEDGLPLALAPYGEPEMYYSPPIDRMSRVEVLKGSGSIVHGPQTIGGVLNFITPDPPQNRRGAVELVGGRRGVFVGQASHGGTEGRMAWLVNALRKQGDGWRGFHYGISDLLAKVNLTLTDRHRLGWKAHVYDERSNSTYLGLTEAQFRRDAAINVVPDDLLRLRRYSGSMMHQWVATPTVLVSSRLYGYTTERNWRRQDFDRARRPGAGYRTIAGDESTPGGAIFLRDSAGNNNRAFDVIGAETRWSIDRHAGGMRHRIEGGARWVHEQHRDRRVDGFTHMALEGVLRENEIRTGGAWSGFIQDRMTISRRWTLTPGLRVERYRYARSILRQPVNGTPTDVNVHRGDSVSKPIPGFGAAFQASPSLTLFAGVHRGFAPPRVKDAITRDGVSLDLDAELSWNWEAGARLAAIRGVRAEAAWFATDFSNQIIPAAQSGGATTTLVNAGRTMHRGVEMSLSVDWSRLAAGAPGFYTELRHTWIADAEFRSGIYLGNRLPYAPRHSFGLRAGWRHRKGFGLHADGTRVGDQFGDNIETMTGSPDGTVGRLPAYWVWNLAAGQEILRERVILSPFVAIKNLADALYISSRAPAGIQPGRFRQVSAGVKIRF